MPETVSMYITGKTAYILMVLDIVILKVAQSVEYDNHKGKRHSGELKEVPFSLHHLKLVTQVVD